MGPRPEKYHKFPIDTGIDSFSLAAVASQESKVFRWSPGLLVQGTLIIDVVAGTGGIGELAITQYDPNEVAVDPTTATQPVDFITALSFTADNVVYFLIGAGETAGISGTGTLAAAASVLKVFTNFSITLDVSTAHTGGAATGSLHLVMLV